jgi:eukaryotic-like serine/threonine-protein kinase
MTVMLDSPARTVMPALPALRAEPPPPPEDFAPPTEFDDYLIVQELGRGQMGQVYLAEDAVLARPVAIKFIAGIDPDLAARQRFLMEARAAARIQHPNVVSIYRVGELADRPYIVSEVVRGKSVADLPMPMPWAQALGLAIDLARGLAAAHRRGVVHCDIKPGNAMLTDDGVAKLVDFGLARVIHDGSDDEAGLMVGTPDYMAPEVWQGRAPSRRSDVYSLGAVLFELIAGATPFGDVSPHELAHAVRTRPAPDLPERAPECDARLARLVARCLDRDPEARYASGEELREALEQLHPSRASAIRTDENPYRGLRPFEASHRGLFFGRGLEIGAVVERLRTDSIVVVTGDSGVGKSSLCRAGVIPAILEGALGGGRSYEALTMVPGRRPLAALAAALGDPSMAARVLEDPEALPRELHRRAGDKGIVLFVDQMEELATVGDPAEVAALDAGLARISEGMPNVRLVTTVRADFLVKIAALPRLGQELSRILFFVSPMPPERIRDVITGPASATGITFESEEMIGELVDATAQAGSGGLPLLSFALAELWEARDKDKSSITQAALTTMGGVAGALARHADAVLASMPAVDRPHARRVLLRLVTSHGTRVRRTEAELSTSSSTKSVLDALVKGRLLVVHDGEDGATFEVAHEVLVNGWGTLRAWLDADAEDRARRERVAAAAAEWQRAGRRSDLTWRGQPLAEALGLDTTNLTALEREFIAASVRAAKRRRWWFRVAVVAILVALVAVYVVQRRIAEHRLAGAVGSEVDAARASLARARAADKEQRTVAQQAFVKFDAGDDLAAETLWKRVVAARALAAREYRTAGSRVEAALAKDPTRDDVRDILGDILLERAMAADALHDTDRRDELLARLPSYDSDGSRRRAWAQPGRLVVHAPAAAQVVLVAGADRRTLGTGEVNEALAPGSYVVELHAAGRETVRAPFVIERGGRAELTLVMPRAGALPKNFIYVPKGEFLYGSSAEEALRTGFFSAMPIHPRTTDAFLIERTEVTNAEWLDFVVAQPEAERAKLLPNIPAKIGGAVVIDRDRDTWRLSLKPMEHTYVAHAGEQVRYIGRNRRSAQNWLKFPVTGVSARLAEQYVVWLAQSGRVPGARLCDELEWEHAGRGADGRSYPHGDAQAEDDFNYDTAYSRDAMGPDEVGSHAVSTSPYGVADMSGNGFEWMHGPGTTYVARGGSYYHDRKTANLANRSVFPPDLADSTLGLRVCATVRRDMY